MGFLRANSKMDSRKQQALSSLPQPVLALVRSPCGHPQPRFHLVEIWAQKSSLKLLLLLMCQPGGRKSSWGSATWDLQYGERRQAVPFPCPLHRAVQFCFMENQYVDLEIMILSGWFSLFSVKPSQHLGSQPPNRGDYQEQ